MARISNPLEIYKLLPQTNCRECYLPSCLAFSAAVIKGEKKLGDCPYIQTDTKKTETEVNVRQHYDEQRTQHLESLKKMISTVDFPHSRDRLGARIVGEKLAITCLGKDFFVDRSGNVTSICHTHAGLTIPLLSYILQSKGGSVTGSWVPFRELKNGTAMGPLFEQRCVKTLKNIADSNTDLFEDIISIFNGEKAENIFPADISIIIHPLPRIPILICYLKAEDDLESDLSIYFDSGAENHLRIESIFELGAGLVMMFDKIAKKHG